MSFCRQKVCTLIEYSFITQQRAGQKAKFLTSNGFESAHNAPELSQDYYQNTS